MFQTVFLLNYYNSTLTTNFHNKQTIQHYAAMPAQLSERRFHFVNIGRITKFVIGGDTNH